MSDDHKGRTTAAQVRAAMFGQAVPGVRVVRQALRVSDDDSDELVLLDVRDTWWVARRVGGAVSVWVYIGDAEAEVGFEQLVAAAAGDGSAWREAAGALLE